MTDEKNQGGGSGDTAAERLAQQRKALNLQTQPLEVIADLDWDVDDDDAEFTLPTPTISPEPAQKKAAAAPRTSSGTMAMSASDFAQAMKNESADAATSTPAEAQAAAETAPEPAAQSATTAKTDIVDTAPHLAKEAAQTAATSSGGTMLLSGDAMKEAMEAAKVEAENSGAEYRETAPHSAVDDAAKTDDAQRSASGTMLMSADAIHEEIEKQAADAKQDPTGPTARTATSGNTGSVEEVSAPAHEPQAPAWNEEEPRREAAQWSAPSAEEGSLKPSGLFPGMSPNLKVTLAIAAVIVVVILLWLIFR